jgi:hypothetical protein
MRIAPPIALVALDDQDVYLVLDDFGEYIGRSWSETDEDWTDRATMIAHLIDGQYTDPVRVVAFNTAKGWARDVSRELADITRWPMDMKKARQYGTGPTDLGFCRR